MNKISVLLVDDHPGVRWGVSALLKTTADLEVIGESDNGRDAVVLAQRTRPDVVIMDVSMPQLNGAEATRQICRTVPSAKVLVLSSYAGDEFVDHLMEAGAVGYVTKDTAAIVLLDAIRAVNAGKAFFGPDISKRLRRRHVQSAVTGQPRKMNPKLTSRQVEVLGLVAEGLSDTRIAAELGISTKAAGKYRHVLMQKLDVHELAGLTQSAISKGLVKL
jgi:DNA-binding NarL/FixJ family response regulator